MVTIASFRSEPPNRGVGWFVGWELRLASLNVDKPNEFVRKVSAFVVWFCISHKHLWKRVLQRGNLGSKGRSGLLSAEGALLKGLKDVHYEA
jgi:hypothetical protein